MLYIIAQISARKALEWIEIYSLVDMVEYKKAIALNHGGDASDYTVLTIAPDDAAYQDTALLLKNRKWDVVWDGDELSGVVYADKLWGDPDGSVDS